MQSREEGSHAKGQRRAYTVIRKPSAVTGGAGSEHR